REEARVPEQVGERARGGDPPAVDVEVIAQQVEGVERDAERQAQVQDGGDRPGPEPRADLVGRRREEVVVLEHAQREQVYKGGGETQPAGTRGTPAHEAGRPEESAGGPPPHPEGGWP